MLEIRNLKHLYWNQEEISSTESSIGYRQAVVFGHVVFVLTSSSLGATIKNVHIIILDAVHQHGGGGVVTAFYDVCNEIRSESPATDSTETGLESIVSLRIRKQILCKKIPKIIVIRNSDEKKLLLRPVGLLASPP